MAKMINRPGRAAALVALTLGLGACAGDYSATPGVYAPTKSEAFGQQRLSGDVPTSYRIGRNDVLQVKVFGEPDLSFDKVVVDQGGKFNMAFVGDVEVVGLTVNEVAAHLRAALGKMIINPQVSVNVVEYGSQKIVVEGSVIHPGIYELPPGTTLLGALATAGDPDRYARVRAIAIVRTDDQGRLLAIVDLHAVRAGKMIDPVLQANDRIIVGVSGRSRFYSDVLQIIPAAVIFSRF